MSERHVHRRESKRVVVVGAGIAGLTAAHELVERGFEVEVVERDMELADHTDGNSSRDMADNRGVVAGTQGVDTLSNPGASLGDILVEPTVLPDDPSLEIQPKVRRVLGWQPRVGGMARTQWAAAPTPPERSRYRVGLSGDRQPRLLRLHPAEVPPPTKLWVLQNDGSPDRFLLPEQQSIGQKDGPEKALQPLIAFLREEPWLSLQLDVALLPTQENEQDPEESIRTSLWRLILSSGGDDSLKPRLSFHWGRKKKLPERIARLAQLDRSGRATSSERAPPEDPASDSRAATKIAAVTVSIQYDRYPAEHGFRFFPSFYLHLFDTMKRTPLPAQSRLMRADRRRLGQRLWDEDSGRTAFDNLVSADKFRFAPLLARHGGHAFAAHRRPPRSVMEMREYLRGLLESIGYDAKSVARLNTKFVQYLTSCEERMREQYESMTWKEFVDPDDKLDPRLAEHLVAAPQALAAMNAEKNDARTIAYVGLQMLLDHFRLTGYSDGTLNGPTSEAWLEPWREYLESQGVVFTAGELVGFEALGSAPFQAMTVRPVVLSAHGVIGYSEPQSWAARPAHWRRVAPADYTVITIPVDKVHAMLHARPAPVPSRQERERQETLRQLGIDLIGAEDLLALNHSWLTTRAWQEPKPRRSLEEAEIEAAERDDLHRYHAFVEERARPEDVEERPDEGPLRWMVGIQFFFECDVQFIKGHTFCSDSPWGVSYLSQAQYWTRKPRGYDGYRGVISAIFTRFEAPGVKYGRPAKYCSPDQVAEEVWEQIVAAMEPSERILDKPLYYYVDENLEWDEDQVWLVHNRTPYLVNHVDDWDRRPGQRVEGGEYRYHLQVGNCVFAGVFMRTHTRLTTMESANESARRAVNAILHDEGSHIQPCRIFRLEDEMAFEDLEPLRELDERLYRRGSRHLVDNWLTESALRALPFDLARLMLPFRDGRAR